MSATATPGALLSANIARNFEGLDCCGTVQVFSEQPAQTFFLTVDGASVGYAEGITQNPTTTVRLRANLLADLVLDSHRYDPRDVRFASRLNVCGNVELGYRLLDLSKTPTVETLQLLERAACRMRQKPVAHVACVRHPDRNFLFAAMADFQPAILSGLLDRWRVWSWSPCALRSHFGDAPLAPFSSARIGDLLDAILPGAGGGAIPGPRYSGGVGLPCVFWKHFPPPPLLEGLVDAPQLWLGRADAGQRPVTGLHCDCRHGFLCQVFGSKRILLYSPDQEHLLYAYRAFNTHRPCRTGPDRVDLDHYPLFKQAKALDVRLRPGETLFIPAGWFHCVFALNEVMSISMAARAHVS